MYSSFQLTKKYLRYYAGASNGKGHGVHSPFVFNFIEKVLNDKKDYECYELIEEARKKLLADNREIEVEDFGAGSAVIKHNTRKVSRMAASSLKSKKYARLLYRIVKYYQPNNIVELGTSFGITTAYLANANPAATIHTLEGAPSVATIAQHQFDALQLENIKLLIGDFEFTLPHLLHNSSTIDFAFIDGNHRKEPTISYFHQLLKKANAGTIFVFDDIHWSEGMEEAWAEICRHDAVTLSIDLFFIGLVFINPDFKIKQHFKIRF